MPSKSQDSKKRQREKAGTSKAAAANRKMLFVEAYIANGGNGLQAAVSAGYSQKGAGVTASRLLKDANVSREIANRSREIANKYALTADLAARSIVQELTFDPAKLYDAAGNLKPITELDEDTRMALTAIEFEQVGSTDAPIYVRKVRWGNRSAARDHLMKHLGMFEKDNAQKAQVMLNLNLAGIPKSA